METRESQLSAGALSKLTALRNYTAMMKGQPAFFLDMHENPHVSELEAMGFVRCSPWKQTKAPETRKWRRWELA